MSDIIEDLPPAERAAIGADFILQAPPGEVNEVVQDVKLILDDFESFDGMVEPTLKLYNEQQYTIVTVPGAGYSTVIAAAALMPGESRYFYPRGRQSFEFDHVKLIASSLEPVTGLADTVTSFLSAVDQPLQAYVSNHFVTGAGAIFPRLTAAPPRPASATPAPDAPTSAPPPEAEAVGEDKIVETALVETADEVAQMARAVEEELKLPQEDGTEVEEQKIPSSSAQEEGDTPEVKVDEEVWQEDEEPIAEEKEKEMTAQPAGDAAVPPEIEEKSSPVEGEPSVADMSAVEAKDEEILAPGPGFTADEEKFTVVLSGQKYSPANFWTGRWRSSYDIDTSKSTFSGKIEVVVHYYEQGNVQLRTVFSPTSIPLPTDPTKVMSSIAAVEKKTHEDINDRLEHLADKAFKSLRRALPVTRQKIEWQAIGNYRLKASSGKGTREEVEAEL